MKTFVTVLALAVLATTWAMAQGKVVRANLAHIYQSDARGNQTFPNPDRDFWGEYFYSRVF